MPNKVNLSIINKIGFTFIQGAKPNKVYLIVIDDVRDYK